MKTSQYIKTLVLVALLLAFTLQKGNGFVLALILPVFLVYLIYTAVRMARRPGERKRRGIRLAIWSAALALAVIVQAYWGVGTRSNADLALQKVIAYKERAGSYPASLGEAGLDERRLQGKWRLHYSVRDGQPRLAYPAPVMPLTTYEYDFEARTWRGNAY